MSPPDSFDRPTLRAFSPLVAYSYDVFRTEALRRHPAAAESTIRAAYDDLPLQPDAARVGDAYACIERAATLPPRAPRDAPSVVPRLDDKYDDQSLTWDLALG